MMRTFGRQCRGKRKVFVTWVRHTERQLLQVGEAWVPLALSAQLYLHEIEALSAAQKARLERRLEDAVEAHQRIEAQSRRLVHGKGLLHCKIVNPYDQTIAPISKGKSNCPTQFGKKPGIIAEMATGFIFGEAGAGGGISGADMNVRVAGSDGTASVVAMDDVGDMFGEMSPDLFEGTFSYGSGFTDGMMLDSISGDATVIVRSPAHEGITGWLASSAEGNHVAL
ncbi:hypothetical protein, partial [uncultured Sphingobium sp.]|uniref:hypothetical protein n=1 Tax=uncultured Sphingobium sp. TaxID=316087 RepID=UPI002638EAB9